MPGPHKELACFPTILHQKLSNCVFCKHLCLYIWEILLFSLQNWLWATLLRVFCEISLISPQKKKFVCFMSNVLLFSIMFVFYSNHCIKIKIFMPFACLLSKLFILWHFHFKMSNSVLHAMSSVLFNNKCVLLQRTLILSEWCFFESNILLFCSQPCIIACIMYFGWCSNVMPT